MRGWILRIAHNTAVSTLRRVKDTATTGTTVFVPNSKLMEAVVERRRPQPADAEAAIDIT